MANQDGGRIVLPAPTWFQRDGNAYTSGAWPADTSWTSPADEGFLAAGVVASPFAGETTAAGLPTRVPSANLVPGSVGGGQPARQGSHADGRQQEPGTPARSADAVRDRLTRLQRGAREGRAATSRNCRTYEN
jgi:hypothetical protein